MKDNLVIFNSELNEFCRTYLMEENPVDTTKKFEAFKQKHDEILASLFEQLLLFEKISFKVHGQNIPLAILINNFGVKGVEQLIEQQALEFVLWTPVVTFNVSDVPEGVLPLQSGNLNSPAHSDPDVSINLGFNSLKNKPDRRILRSLHKKLRKVYKIPDNQFSHNAANLVIDAYKSNKLKELGMPNDLDVAKLPYDKRKRLCGHATEVLETTILSQFKYSSFQRIECFTIAQASFNNIQYAIKMKEYAGKIFEIEDIPDLKNLFIENKLDVMTLLKFRQNPHAVKFRHWLYAISKNENSKGIAREYIDSLLQKNGFFDSNKGKFVKTISLYTLGAGLGTLVAGIPGSLAGLSIAKMIEPASELGLDLVDTYCLDGLLKGWNPRNFIDKFKSSIIP